MNSPRSKLTLPPVLLQRRLLHRIHRRYQTVTENLRFGSIALAFTRVAHPNRVLDEVAAEEDRREKSDAAFSSGPAHMPYWAELWESAGGVAMALTEMPLTSVSRVLDLGCGMGLAGAVAAALGKRVLFADLEPAALLFARLNVLPFVPRARTRRLNWQSDRLDEHFDLILGADILYERKQWEFLDAFWNRHLSPGGAVILGEPGRQTGEMFGPWIEERGWRMRESQQPIPGREKPIRILRLDRR